MHQNETSLQLPMATRMASFQKYQPSCCLAQDQHQNTDICMEYANVLQKINTSGIIGGFCAPRQRLTSALVSSYWTVWTSMVAPSPGNSGAHSAMASQAAARMGGTGRGEGNRKRTGPRPLGWFRGPVKLEHTWTWKGRLTKKALGS